MEMATDSYGQDPTGEDETVHDPKACAHVKSLIETIKADKEHHKKPFEQMREDMFMAFHGRDKTWAESNYKANISGRHVKQKTSSLYAKNPKAVAKRREMMDFVIWDEDPASLQMALQTVQVAQQMVAQAAAVTAAQGPTIDSVSGLPAPPPQPTLPPDVMQGVMQAQALIQDFQQGMQRREQAKKLGRTLELLFADAMREQKPVDFKTGMKQCVRRAATTGVGYVELGFQREYGPRPGLTEQLADARARLDHLAHLVKDAAEGEIEEDDSEMAELQASVAALQAEPEIVLREGLIFDFPQSTKVIPDKLCRSLVGFIGARHLTIEYMFTIDEVEELFQVDLKKGGFTGYSEDDKQIGPNYVIDDEDDTIGLNTPTSMVCVWKHYDKATGLVTYVADGYKYYLRAPAAPDVFVEDFWPVYALTFNAVESETELFPPSDVKLLKDMQLEYNRNRQGKREHRHAARPRWAHRKGALSDEDIERFKRQQPFDNIGLEWDGQQPLKELLEVIPVPGVDPNLYDVGEIFADIQLVGGQQEANYGGVAKATATESAIAANSTAATDHSSVDDLDAFLTVVTRGGGQILFREMSEEKVKEIVGPGAFWPPMTLAQIAGEVFLEVEAGSTGKPNQAIEIQNWKEMLPFLIQLGSIQPLWLARESLRRLDDRMDLTEAVAAGIPSIVSMNQSMQPGPEDPAADPKAQGDKGGNNGPQPPGQTGSEPAFGSNQV